MDGLVWMVQDGFTHMTGVLTGWLEDWAQLGLLTGVPACVFPSMVVPGFLHGCSRLARLAVRSCQALSDLPTKVSEHYFLHILLVN